MFSLCFRENDLMWLQSSEFFLKDAFLQVQCLGVMSMLIQREDGFKQCDWNMFTVTNFECCFSAAPFFKDHHSEQIHITDLPDTNWA